MCLVPRVAWIPEDGLAELLLLPPVAPLLRRLLLLLLLLLLLWKRLARIPTARIPAPLPRISPFAAFETSFPVSWHLDRSHSLFRRFYSAQGCGSLRGVHFGVLHARQNIRGESAAGIRWEGRWLQLRLRLRRLLLRLRLRLLRLLRLLRRKLCLLLGRLRLRVRVRPVCAIISTQQWLLLLRARRRRQPVSNR
jgi:hypothetical protein